MCQGGAWHTAFSHSPGRSPVPNSSGLTGCGIAQVGWEIYVGAAACVAVFALGAWEFIKRIVCCRHNCGCSQAACVSSKPRSFNHALRA